MDTKTEFNLNNIIATLPLISISWVKKFAGKCPQTWSCPKLLDIDTLCGLDVTISVPRQLTSFPLRHWNLRNLTLQQECDLASTRAYFHTFAQLYNAAASPASRLCSAGLLAIIWLHCNIYILLDILLCSIAEYFYEFCHILANP